ncbi:MAG: efflux RND transporter periplasmic adaptor subunit [Pirellulales bacterium]
MNNHENQLAQLGRDARPDLRCRTWRVRTTSGSVTVRSACSHLHRRQRHLAGICNAAAPPALTAPTRDPVAGLALEAFAEPFRTLPLSIADPGRIHAVHVQRGDTVTAGQLLVELDVAPLAASRRLAEQRANSTARRDALIVERTRRQRRHDALGRLRREGAGTSEELLEAAAELRIAELRVQEAEEELERARLAVAELDAQIEQRRVRAPLDGVITEIQREVGEFVSAADPQLLTLVVLHPLRLTYYVPTDVAVRRRTGESIGVRFEGRDDVQLGVIDHIGPVTQPESGRVRLDVLLDNPTGQLRSGLRGRLLVPSPGPQTAR